MNTLRGTVSFEFLSENRWTTECKMSCWRSAVCILTTLGNGWALTPIYIVTASLFSQVHLRLLSHCYWEKNVRKCQWTCPPSHSLQTTWQIGGDVRDWFGGVQYRISTGDWCLCSDGQYNACRWYPQKCTVEWLELGCVSDSRALPSEVYRPVSIPGQDGYKKNKK